MFDGAALVLCGSGLAVFSWLFNANHTVRCVDTVVEATGLAAVGAAGANVAGIAYGVTLFVGVPLAALVLIATRRWRLLAIAVALFAVAVALAVPLYGHAPAFTYGEAKACT